MAMVDIFIRAARAFFSELRMTKPESQNTGIDTR
ncbi:hypothetical protein ABIA46_000844 [Pseudomonas aeruginosa]|nr:Uncharacterised protein [Pseudomonas aeruginosa]